MSFDRDRAEDLGVPVGDVATTLQALLGGSRTEHVHPDNKLYDVILQLDPRARATPSDMTGLYMRGRDGAAGEARGGGDASRKASGRASSTTSTACARPR